MVNLSDFYDALKFWLPIITGFTLIYKLVDKGVNAFGDWADKLLDNHLTHIQAATESTAESLKQLVSLHGMTAKAITKVADDLREHEDKDDRVQGEIAKNVAILLDRK